MSKLVAAGLVLGALGFSSSALAATYAGCGFSSPLKSRNAAGSLVSAASVFPDSGDVPTFQAPTFVATAPDATIVLLIPNGSDWTQRPLYWPTPTDPKYDYRKMRRLPTDTKLVANDFGQRIEILRVATNILVDGVTTTYQPLDYNGHYLLIDGCGGSDNIRGGDGNDHIYDYVGDGNEMRGYGGRDWIEGIGVFMSGGDGEDCMYGLGNSIDMQGDAGNDRLDADPGYFFTKNNGGAGTDSCSAVTHASCESVAAANCTGWL